VPRGAARRGVTEPAGESSVIRRDERDDETDVGMSLKHIGTLALLATASGCGILDPDDGARSDLEVNRERWESVRPQSYSMVLRRLCFCIEAAIGPVRISVVGTTATQRVYVDSGEPVPGDLAPHFPTVDGLFDVIKDAMDRDVHQLRVTYDGDTGIPVDIWIDYEANAVDEELGYQVTLPLGE
jgi:hypothetical protein